MSGGKANDETYYIGCTVTGSDISVGRTQEGVAINLPSGRVANIQLVGKIHPSHKCMYISWDGKEYTYSSYEVLMLKVKPKR